MKNKELAQLLLGFDPEAEVGVVISFEHSGLEPDDELVVEDGDSGVIYEVSGVEGLGVGLYVGFLAEDDEG